MLRLVSLSQDLRMKERGKEFSGNDEGIRTHRSQSLIHRFRGSARSFYSRERIGRWREKSRGIKYTRRKSARARAAATWSMRGLISRALNRFAAAAMEGWKKKERGVRKKKKKKKKRISSPSEKKKNQRASSSLAESRLSFAPNYQPIKRNCFALASEFSPGPIKPIFLIRISRWRREERFLSRLHSLPRREFGNAMETCPIGIADNLGFQLFGCAWSIELFSSANLVDWKSPTFAIATYRVRSSENTISLEVNRCNFCHLLHFENTQVSLSIMQVSRKSLLEITKRHLHARAFDFFFASSSSSCFCALAIGNGNPIGNYGRAGREKSRCSAKHLRKVNADSLNLFPDRANASQRGRGSLVRIPRRDKPIRENFSQKVSWLWAAR